MKVFFATNELTYNTKFFQMVIASINSCLKNTTLTPYLIYDGDNKLTEIPCEGKRWKSNIPKSLAQFNNKLNIMMTIDMLLVEYNKLKKLHNMLK